MNWRRIASKLAGDLPHWLTFDFFAIVAVGVFVLIGWIKPYLNGPDLALATIYRSKPVPVKVETVKWMQRIKTVQVSVPVEVIREVPAKEAARLDKDFGIKLDLLHAENKELAKVLDVPKAPHGGEMALTVNTGTGAIEGVFSAAQAPFFEAGGIREVGVDYNVLQRGVTAYYRQDLFRAAAFVVNGKVFATVPLSPGARPAYGAQLGVAMRF